MKVLFLLLLFCHVSSSVKHSLKYFLTGSDGVPNFPEFMAAAAVDEHLVAYCDINRKTVEPKQEWMKTLLENDPQVLEWYRRECFQIQPNLFKTTLSSLKQRFNQSGELPSVSLLQKTPSSPVSCHASGFYPDRATLIWRKDGEELHEDVELGEILPNHDGTFQTSADLNVSSVPPEDWRRYDCVFHLSGVKDDDVTKLDKAEIRTNWVSPPEFPVVAVVIGLLLLTVFIIGLYMWRRNNR
ncbi:major histocompatibility complex class I-related protein 1-like isoform X3 [Chaetodon auriga]|uniref:major histocompatibility complex class I-related protein 1-like isoform X3 n=1 Tax=Chaetodon auriga TaxID=39042 RepID=UPI004032A2DB